MPGPRVQSPGSLTRARLGVPWGRKIVVVILEHLHGETFSHYLANVVANVVKDRPTRPSGHVRLLSTVC